MSTADEVSVFLSDFKVKLEIWGVYFHDDRGKNLQTLLELEISTEDRRKVLRELKPEDYSKGPLEDKLYGKESMWVFGKMVKRKEIYIKITLGKASYNVICISFHISEHPMNYPLKS